MTSTQVNKKRNHLGKPEYYIITLNEYILDLLHSPLFYVDILDSKIPDKNVSSGWHRNENSHMIHITSIEKSIWQGEVWSKIYFKIKVGKNFIHIPSKGMTFTLHPEV